VVTAVPMLLIALADQYVQKCALAERAAALIKTTPFLFGTEGSASRWRRVTLGA